MLSRPKLTQTRNFNSQKSFDTNSDFHQNYYLKLRAAIERIEGTQSKELAKYSQSYDDELKQFSFEKAPSKFFFDEISSADMILCGDFHGQAQSTRSLMRLCRNLKSKKKVLILECFRKEDQKYIDQFLSQKITEQDFLKKIEWSKKWSFSWSITRPLIKWALINQIPVFGMNKISPHIQLKQRDQFFSEQILSIQKKYSSHQLIIQVGDFHLAEKHLPVLIRKKNHQLKLHKIYQSPDFIYFKKQTKLKSNFDSRTSDFYKLGKNNWAMMTVLPWVKWQDYLLHLESNLDNSLNDIDFTDHVDRYVDLVKQILKIKLSHEKLNVYWAGDDQVKRRLSQLPTLLRRQVKFRLSLSESCFIPELQIGILSRLTVNHLAKIAAQYILFETGLYKKTSLHSKNEFVKMIWFEMNVYFISKITNPKRKTDTLKDIKSALQSSQNRAKEKEALILSLNQKMKELRFGTYGQVSSLPHRTRFRASSYATASQILGGILGEKVFSAFQKKRIKFPESYSFIFRNTDQSQFEQLYYELIDIIESWPVPFQSKYEQF